MHTWDLPDLPNIIYIIYIYIFILIYIYTAICSSLVSCCGTLPKVTACAGGPNALAAISLSRGSLERHHGIEGRIWIPFFSQVSCLAFFCGLIYLIKVKVSGISIGCHVLILWENVFAPANDMIIKYDTAINDMDTVMVVQQGMIGWQGRICLAFSTGNNPVVSF